MEDYKWINVYKRNLSCECLNDVAFTHLMSYWDKDKELLVLERLCVDCACQKYKGDRPRYEEDQLSKYLNKQPIDITQHWTRYGYISIYLPKLIYQRYEDMEDIETTKIFTNNKGLHYRTTSDKRLITLRKLYTFSKFKLHTIRDTPRKPNKDYHKAHKTTIMQLLPREEIELYNCLTEGCTKDVYIHRINNLYELINSGEVEREGKILKQSNANISDTEELKLLLGEELN